MYPGILYLQLADHFILLEEIALDLLYFVEVVFDERQILAVIEFIHLNLELRMVCFELLHYRYQNILFSLQIISLDLQLVSPFLLLF